MGIPRKKWDGNSQKHQHGDSQEFLGKKGLAPGIPKKTGWTSEIPGKNGIGSSNSLGKWDGDSQETGMDAGNSQENRIHSQKKKKIRLGLHRESGVTDWSGNQGLDPVGIWDLGIGSHSQRQSQGIPGTFLMAYVGSPGRIRTTLPSQNSATTRSFFQPCREFPKKPFRTVDPGIWDWGILESQDWRILRLGDPRILRLGDPRIGGSWNSRTGGFWDPKTGGIQVLGDPGISGL